MKNRFSVHFFNTYLSGGAGIASTRLFENLSGPEIDSTFFYRDTAGADNGNPALQFVRKDPYHAMDFLRRKLFSVRARSYYKEHRNALNGRQDGYEQFSPSFQPIKTPYNFFGAHPDIIHLHWIAEWIDYPSFFRTIPDHLPVVWTLHDMNPFTAGCHYSWECERYSGGCRDCPQLGIKGTNRYEIKSFDLKKIIRNKNINVVTSSKWLKEIAGNSFLFEKLRSIQTIPFGIADESSLPGEKIQPGKKSMVVGLGATDPGNRRKGMEGLAEIVRLTALGAPHIRFKLFGKTHSDFMAGSAVELTGPLTGREQLNEFYSACDVFIVLSLHEAFGLTALEAMACGTPVLAFDSGGLRDTVIDGKTGWLVPAGDYKAIAEKLIYIYNNQEEFSSYGHSAMEHVRSGFNRERERNSYLKLYRSLLN